jgi:hypothetical protein
MVSTARELWRWAEGLRSGRTLGADGWALMSARHSMDSDSAGYGYGVWVSQLSGARTLKTLGGDVEGYRAECRIYPEDDRVIVVLTNQDLFALGVQRRVIANALSRLAQGLDPPQPPAVAPPGARPAGIEGAWALPGGGRIEVWRENGRLRLGARGQEAVDLFEPDDPGAIAVRHRLLARTDSLMRGALPGDTAFVHRVLPPSEYGFSYPFLRGNLTGLEALDGDIEEVTGLGVAALPWSNDTFRSYVRLHFRDRSEDVFFGFTAGTLNDVTVGEGRPFPVMLPVAPLAESGFATFDMVRQRAVRLRLRAAADGSPELVVPTAGGEIVARRVR